MNIQKKEVLINCPAIKATSSAIVDSDAIVNDSKPDLLKIIKICPVVKVSKTELLNGKMMVSGHISYTVIYQPEDASGVCSLHTSADFSHMEENPDFKEGMYCDVIADAEHIECELINSRKIKIKTVLSLDVSVYSQIPIMLPISVDGDNLQIKCGQFDGVSRFLQKRDIITISDSITIPAGKPNVGNLLKSDVCISNKDIKIISGKVIIKGDLVMSCMYIPESSPEIECFSQNMPFTEILDAEGIKEDSKCSVRTNVDECDISLATDSDGDIRVLNTNVRIGVKISADAPISETVVTDLYSLTDNLDINYKIVNVTSPISSTDFDHTLKCSLRPNITQVITSVYGMEAKPYITSALMSDGKMIIDGLVDISYLCTTADRNCPLMSLSDETPFKIECMVPSSPEGAKPSADIEINTINYNLGASGEVDLRIVMSCHAEVCKDEKVRIVDSIASSERANEKSPSIVLYFVQKGDTLWDIAKRYHTKTEYIEELNGDNCSPLVEGSHLMIPRG